MLFLSNYLQQNFLFCNTDPYYRLGYYNVAMMQKDKTEQLLLYETYAENYRRRTEMRNRNFQQRDEDLLVGQKRNAQIKSIQKFIGKLKTDNKNSEAIFAELETLNMSKYIEQVSNIIVTSINEKQIPFYAEIATRLNISYENVPATIIKDLCKNFNQYVESQEDNKSKIKSLFLFSVELFVCGFSFSYKEILEMIKKVFKCGKNKRNSYNSEIENKLHLYCYSSTIFSTFLSQFAQTFTKREPEWIKIWKNQQKQVFKYPEVLPMKTKEQLTIFFSKYALECFGVLKDVIELIKKYEAELFQCLRLDGEFNKQTEKGYVEIVEKFLITKKHIKLIISAISETIDSSELDVKITTIPEIMARYIDKADNAVIFQDEFQKQIYENIPELVTSEQKSTTEEQYKQFKQLLDNCKNVNDSNQICKAFNLINNKKNRKSLAKDALQYRKQYHLVTPYLCRVIAVISLHYKDIGQTVNDLIFAQYEKIKETQSANFVSNDKKSRIMKYICEFTKFKVIDAEKTMNCIQNLIDNLNGYNIQLIVSVLENVGRFLHLSENSANRFTFLMKKYENIIKKKSLPILTTSQLINSINMLKPRKEIEKLEQRQKTAEQIQAQKIMETCVVNNIDDLMNQIDGIMKTNQGFDALKVAFLRKIQKFDFMNNYNYAYLLEELKYNKLSDFVVERTIQNLLLYISNGENQKTILWAKFLAELYNYKIIERSLLFSTIQSLLKVTNNEIGVIHALCFIFEACSGYLDTKKISKKNERFLLLVKFKKFLSKCKYIPMLEEYQIVELFDQYEPDLTEIDKKLLEEFIQITDNKMKNQNKELSYSEELDKYLSKKNLKKFTEKVQNKDTRGQEQSPEKVVKVQTEQVNLVQQSKLFDKQLTSIMEQNRKDYSSRIAKPMYLEKNFDKKRQKKKNGPCVTVIGRSGNRFIKKDIAKTEQKKTQ